MSYDLFVVAATSNSHLTVHFTVTQLYYRILYLIVCSRCVEGLHTKDMVQHKDILK